MGDVTNEPADPDDVQIAFIGGWGRSGSTLLARMISEAPGFTGVGEVRDVFLRGIIEDRVCGCGTRFQQCEFWQAIGEEAFGGWHTLSVEHLKRLRTLTDKPWHVPALLRPGLHKRTDEAVAEYGAILRELYRAIRRVTGARVIVDASKIASYGAILQRTEGLTPTFVHLVRDPRGTLNSWTKRVHMTDDLDKVRFMPRYRVSSGAARYMGYNLEMHAVAARSAHLQLKYEDLVADPDEKLRDVLALFDVPRTVDTSAFIGPDGVRLGMSHTIAGNPMRHESGWVPLNLDEAWRQSMPTHQQRLITALTFPLMRRYGYDIGASWRSTGDAADAA